MAYPWDAAFHYMAGAFMPAVVVIAVPVGLAGLVLSVGMARRRSVARRRLEAFGKAMLAGLTAYAWYWSPATRTRRREPRQIPETGQRPEPVAAEPLAGPPPGHPERMPRRTRLNRVERALFKQLERSGQDG